MPRPGDRPAANIHSTRSVVMGRHGMIATSQPLASAAGLRVMQEGGNAIDAAVAAAAVLAVVEPSMTGIGGDLFAIIYDAKTKTLKALNASGRSGHAATPAEFAKRGETRVPAAGVLSVTVPGVVEGWSELLSKFGTLPMSRVVAPAIDYAKNGYPVSEIISRQWKSGERKLGADAQAAAVFLPNGRAPAAGEIFSNPKLAATLELIAKGGRDAFYKGPIAKAIVADMKQPERPAGRERLRRAQSRLGRSDLHEVPRVRHLRDAAEHARVPRARDAQHPRRLRREVDGLQLARVHSRARRGQADCVCRPRGVSRGPVLRAAFRVEDAHLEGIRGDAAEGDQSSSCSGILQARNDTGSRYPVHELPSPIRISPDSIAATRST